jgi:hypothetical protein
MRGPVWRPCVRAALPGTGRFRRLAQPAQLGTWASACRHLLSATAGQGPPCPAGRRHAHHLFFPASGILSRPGQSLARRFRKRQQLRPDCPGSHRISHRQTGGRDQIPRLVHRPRAGLHGEPRLHGGADDHSGMEPHLPAALRNVPVRTFRPLQLFLGVLPGDGGAAVFPWVQGIHLAEIRLPRRGRLRPRRHPHQPLPGRKPGARFPGGHRQRASAGTGLFQLQIVVEHLAARHRTAGPGADIRKRPRPLDRP